MYNFNNQLNILHIQLYIHFHVSYVYDFNDQLNLTSYPASHSCPCIVYHNMYDCNDQLNFISSFTFILCTVYHVVDEFHDFNTLEISLQYHVVFCGRGSACKC
jgi:hypothetical protein